jgi:MFS family permease
MSMTNNRPTDTSTKSSDASSRYNSRHKRLTSNPIFWSSIGVTQTLLTAGIVFGWASLLPVLRDEGVDHTPQEFARIFTCGAVGNYVSTLAFGLILDHYGPRSTAILASLMFSVGCILCCQNDSFTSLLVGFGLVGFSGPGIQMPTLHLANLFGGEAREGGSGGGAIYMSAQAAAFDGGTAVFAIVRMAHQHYSLKTSTFFLLYLIIPLWVLLTALFVWPDDVIADSSLREESLLATKTETETKSPYIGPGSPYLSPGMIRLREIDKKNNSLYDAPLSVVLRHSSFWTLAIWVSIHILKLNFVVATINDQLDDVVNADEAESLIGMFGAMLPFGFVILPVVAWFLQNSAQWAFQLANIVGLVYGVILVYFSSNSWLLKCFVFPAVATSRQMVYSTIFHQIGVTFGFANYGVLLGLTNILVSAFSLIQNPLVNWSEIQGDYTSANTILLLMTLPLFAAGLLTDPSNQKTTQKSFSNHSKGSTNLVMDEETPLFSKTRNNKARSNSESFL